MKRWKLLRGMAGAKVVAFLLALVLAGTACAGVGGALYLYTAYGRSGADTDYGAIWEEMMYDVESVRDYLFLSLYQDALTPKGETLYQDLSQRLDSAATNLRFRVTNAEGRELFGNGTEEFWRDSSRQTDAWTEADSAYDLGRSRELSYYLNIDQTKDWIQQVGTANDWFNTSMASEYYYPLEEADIELTMEEALGEEITADTGIETDAAESNPMEDEDAAALVPEEEYYYYYVYQGNDTIYHLEATVDNTFPVKDTYYDIDQSYQQERAFYEGYCLPLLVAGLSALAGFCLVLTWLTWSAGWNRKGELALRGLNRLPGEVVLAAGGFAGVVLLQILSWSLPVGGSVLSFLIVAGSLGVCGCLICLTIWYIFTAQIKTKMVVKNSLCYRLGGKLCRVWHKLYRNLFAALREWPLYWKTALACLIYSLVQSLWSLVIVQDLFWNYGFNLFTWLVESIPLVVAALFLCKWALDFARIRKETNQIAQGDLDYQIDTTHMLPDLKEHAQELGRISQGLSKAVEERVKGQRFKTELITNVSHDLKTPLTSIINYVDLLKKADIQDETLRSYIDVLDRKSQRLKTLTEDLVEASKAASGTIAVQLERLDLPQLVEQAVAEYQERLEHAGLTPMIQTPKEPCFVQADGRHLWRVLDNLLGNCTKYAMPGTRVYLDVTATGTQATVTVKNISADPLNVPAEELMKRFVRGDSSRSTEGSGLGLSIARNLTNAQKGSFDLVVDGDLFKAVVTLPQAKPEPAAPAAQPDQGEKPSQPAEPKQEGEPSPLPAEEPAPSGLAALLDELS